MEQHAQFAQLTRTKRRLVTLPAHPVLRIPSRLLLRQRKTLVFVMLGIKMKNVDLQEGRAFGVTNSVDGQEEVGITETSGMPQLSKARMDVFLMKILRGMLRDGRICGFGQMEEILCLIIR